MNATVNVVVDTPDKSLQLELHAVCVLGTARTMGANDLNHDIEVFLSERTL